MIMAIPTEKELEEMAFELRFLDVNHPKVVALNKYMAFVRVEREKQQRLETTRRIRAGLKSLRKSLPDDATKRQISDAM